ncbi:uncharacterized protein LOC118437173 [Folsomia candida]|uniref:uncharacterized protein LOC118437173 n=1 Tax=Folsomia candida TaxID=158441 RepID=UPI001604B133|nr:uncharacterized protein LOC118437173 [Folsomia candida]
MKLRLIVICWLALIGGSCAAPQLPEMGALPGRALPTSDLANLNTAISNLTLELQEVTNDPFSVLLEQETQLVSTLESSLSSLTTSVPQLTPGQGTAPLPATAKGILYDLIPSVQTLLSQIIAKLRPRLDKAVEDGNTELTDRLTGLLDILKRILTSLETMQAVIKNVTNWANLVLTR